MRGASIKLFMWGYQEHFRVSLEYLASKIFSVLGSDIKAEVLLVGCLKPGGKREHPVCVSPEDGKWPLQIFDNLPQEVEIAYRNNALHNMYYGDERSMQEKPEWARRDSVKICVGRKLEDYDQLNDVISICGPSRLVDDYYVTPVIQVPKKTFEHFPPLPTWGKRDEYERQGPRSLIYAAMSVLLQEAATELEQADPGRSLSGQMRSDEEIIRIAARNFLWTVANSIDPRHYENDLFNVLNVVSSLMYEGTKGSGDLILTSSQQTTIKYIARFAKPVPLREPRWVRKVLQMAKEGVSIIADCNHIYGLGTFVPEGVTDEQAGFLVRFVDHYHWELCFRSRVLLRSHYSVPRLPQEPFDKTVFVANYLRMFPKADEQHALHLWSLMKVQTQLRHGSMIVVASDVSAESNRLEAQGTCIEPVDLSDSLLRSAAGIDGTILVDPLGKCHAIGVILDGDTSDLCTPSRGSRYNSGVRYVKAGMNKRLAIVVSDDGTVDLIPALRPLINAKLIEEHIILLECATRENYHKARNWVDKHRFYMNDEQCNRINVALDRLDALPSDESIYIMTARFAPHPEMDESYVIGYK